MVVLDFSPTIKTIFRLPRHTKTPKMVPDEVVSFLSQAPAQHVTEAMRRISLVTSQVNALFWSTRWSAHVHITLLRHLWGGGSHPPATRGYTPTPTQIRHYSC